MATVTLNPSFTNCRGNIGRIIFYKRYDTLCARSHVYPRNPNTPAQRLIRRTFAEAVKAWQLLPVTEKEFYNKKSARKHLSGYNLFISGYMKGNREKIVSISPKLQAPFPSSGEHPLRSCSVSASVTRDSCCFTPSLLKLTGD